jgi:hypothetical protein
MDPNATLAEIRRLAAAALSGEYAIGDMDGVATELAEYVTALDEWVATGGFLPDAWRQEDRFLN